MSAAPDTTAATVKSCHRGTKCSYWKRMNNGEYTLVDRIHCSANGHGEHPAIPFEPTDEQRARATAMVAVIAATRVPKTTECRYHTECSIWKRNMRDLVSSELAEKRKMRDLVPSELAEKTAAHLRNCTHTAQAVCKDGDK